MFPSGPDHLYDPPAIVAKAPHTEGARIDAQKGQFFPDQNPGIKDNKSQDTQKNSFPPPPSQSFSSPAQLASPIVVQEATVRHIRTIFFAPATTLNPHTQEKGHQDSSAHNETKESNKDLRAEALKLLQEIKNYLEQKKSVKEEDERQALEKKIAEKESLLRAIAEKSPRMRSFVSKKRKTFLSSSEEEGEKADEFEVLSARKRALTEKLKDHTIQAWEYRELQDIDRRLSDPNLAHNKKEQTEKRKARGIELLNTKKGAKEGKKSLKKSREKTVRKVQSVKRKHELSKEAKKEIEGILAGIKDLSKKTDAQRKKIEKRKTQTIDETQRRQNVRIKKTLHLDEPPPPPEPKPREEDDADYYDLDEDSEIGPETKSRDWIDEKGWSVYDSERKKETALKQHYDEYVQTRYPETPEGTETSEG